MSTSYTSPPSTFPPGCKVVAYIRDSGGSDQELSVSRQITEITRWASEYSITITHLFTDEARSGRSLHKRDQLQNMLDHFRNGAEERGIVVWSYDRFARNAVHSQLCRSEIRSLGYTFHSLTDYIPEGSEGVIFEAFKDYVAEQFSHKLSVNVKSGLRDILEKHKALGGFPPAGFMREPIEIGIHRSGKPRIVHKWVPDPDLVPTVRLAFEMRGRGATFGQIMAATKLFPSINSFTTFFTNRIYMGIMESGDIVIKDYCEPIVTPELWDKVQEVGRSRSKITEENNPRRIGSQFLLSGLIYCQGCGSPMNGHVVQPSDGRKRRDYYSCSRKSRRLDCNAREIPRHALEAGVIQKLESLALDLERLLQFQVRVQAHYKRMFSQTEGERSRLRRELREKTRRIDNIVGAIAYRGHSKSMIDALHKVELEQAALQIQVENMERELRPPQEYTSMQLSALAEEIRSALDGDDLSKKKYAVHMLTSRVIASRTDASVDGVLYYIPNVCVGVGTPAEVLTEGIQFSIAIPKYTKVARA